MEFSTEFQLRLLIVFLTDKEFYVNSKELVQQEFFKTLFGQWVFNKTNEYFEIYKGMPTHFVLLESLKTDSTFILIPEEEKLIDEFFKNLASPDKIELQYVKDNFISFAKSKSLKQVIHEQSEEIESGDFDKILFSLKDESKKFNPLISQLDPELFSMRNLTEILNVKEGIKTGINLIDSTIGGLKPKELSLVLADTNVGKSLYLTQVGGHAIRQYKNVLHVTLEMSFAKCLARYLANLSEPEDNITYNMITSFEPQDKVFEYVNVNLKKKYEGRLKIVEFPSGKCTIQDLYNLLDKYPETNLLLVDYLQLLQPVKKRTELRHELSDLAVALRGLASETGVHCASASQASRQASGRRIVGKEYAAEDYGIFRTADIGIGMGQTRDDDIKKEVVFYITKSRDSEKNKAERYFIDYKTMKFKFLRQEDLSVKHV